MGTYMVGTWLYAFITMLPAGLWAAYSLTKEGWMSSRGPKEKFARFAVWATIVYQILLPLYWCWVVSPNGIPYVG